MKTLVIKCNYCGKEISYTFDLETYEAYMDELLEFYCEDCWKIGNV